MEKLVRFALASLFLLGIASAQNIPAINVFGGYSYLNFDLPTTSVTSAQRLALNGWDFSASVHVFRRLAVEGDVSGHNLTDCVSTSITCSNLSYMIGPRFMVGKSSGRITGFVHGLFGRDRLDLPESDTSVTDTSVGFAAGGGIDYWVFRHIGVQLGPADFLYTRHLNSYNGPSQDNFRVSGGIVFRFGGPSSENEPAPRESAPKSKRASKGQPSAAPEIAPQPAQPLPGVPGRGMSIASLGVVVMPQEFDGAKILQIVPGGVAEMASLKAGDLIRSVDGKSVRTPMELAAELSDKSGKVRIGILRGDFATETLILLGGR
jgi:hypothetical protein